MRYTINKHNFREPIGTFDSKRPPLALTPTSLGYFERAAAIEAGKLAELHKRHIGIGGLPGPRCLAACGSLVAISLPSDQQRSPLSLRELGAALLYASGHFNKAIAQTLGLTPANARTYLRSSYALLGVCNKVELASALRRT